MCKVFFVCEKPQFRTALGGGGGGASVECTVRLEHQSLEASLGQLLRWPFASV